jgi:hypothetical protein
METTVKTIDPASTDASQQLSPMNLQYYMHRPTLLSGQRA